MILEDLQAGRISLDEEEQSAEYLWGIYSQTDEFIAEKVEYHQFKARLKDHRMQVQKVDESISLQMAALDHDKMFTQPASHDERGQPRFQQTQAFTHLKHDVRDGLHKQMTLDEFYESRVEYQDDYNRADFAKKVFQISRRQKFINHLENKRQEEASKRAHRRNKLGVSIDRFPDL